ncbi:hypothetical protein SUGI_0281680 [Cryptomeria japonica]|nr:hypothetical protein SUGI_0281680 [Cryptomeria japonica]
MARHRVGRDSYDVDSLEATSRLHVMSPDFRGRQDTHYTSGGNNVGEGLVAVELGKAHTVEDFALTDELMDMVFAHEPQTQDATAVSHTPPPVTIAATSMPEFVGYTGTPSASRACPMKKDSSKMPKQRAEEISIPISSMANPPPCTGEASRDLVIAIVSISMVSHPQSIGEASQAHTPSRSADEPSTEPRIASKRLDFYDPPQV